MVIKLFLIALFFILNSCASDKDDRPPYIQNYIPDVYTCEYSACGAYPELLKCSDGSYAGELQCVFVEDFGCAWVGTNCDAGVSNEP